MSAADRALKAQAQKDRLFQAGVKRALGVALADPELWPLLQWLYYEECAFLDTTYGDASHMAFTEGKRSVGFALQAKANQIDWSNWHKLKAAFEMPPPRGGEQEEMQAEIEGEE